MNLFLLFVIAGYAVRCDEMNNYVIEMLDDPPIRAKKTFQVYWNVPTMQCKSKKIPFDNLYERYGIIQNANDRFRGEKITILYDPGLFPALLKNETSGKFKFRNGGVPQEGDLNEHLDAFKKDLDQSIPDLEFNGVGVIDFESWRPSFRQNFGVLKPYKDVSIEIERSLHWWWSKSRIEAEAKRRFEESARTFMWSTLATARRLRPRAVWGFYGFPYCFNMASNNMREACADKVPEENDQISWLWAESSALFPSVYSSAALSGEQLAALLRGRLREAARPAPPAPPTPPSPPAPPRDLLPYFWFRYRDAGYFRQTDLATALATIYKSNASGIIIWGSSNDVNTATKCRNLLNYVESTFGPAIAKYTKPLNKINNDINNDNKYVEDTNDSRTNNPITTISASLNTKSDIDPEFNWDSVTNNPDDINNRVKDEIREKEEHNSTDTMIVPLKNKLFEILIKSVINAMNRTRISNTGSSNNSVTNKLFDIDVSSTTNTVEQKEEVEFNVIQSSSESVVKDLPIQLSTHKYLSIDSITLAEMTTTTENIKFETKDDNGFVDATDSKQTESFFNVDTYTKNYVTTTKMDYSIELAQAKDNTIQFENSHDSAFENDYIKTNEFDSEPNTNTLPKITKSDDVTTEYNYYNSDEDFFKDDYLFTLESNNVSPILNSDDLVTEISNSSQQLTTSKSIISDENAESSTDFGRLSLDPDLRKSENTIPLIGNDLPVTKNIESSSESIYSKQTTDFKLIESESLNNLESTTPDISTESYMKSVSNFKPQPAPTVDSTNDQVVVYVLLNT